MTKRTRTKKKTRTYNIIINEYIKIQGGFREMKKKHILPVGIVGLAVIAVAVVVLAVAFGRHAGMGPLGRLQKK